MQYEAEFADPLFDVRDVVESFRSFGIKPTDWRRVLSDAAAALDQVPHEADRDAFLADLIANIRVLLVQGLDSSPKALNKVAEQVAIALSEIRVPGIPSPEDQDWGFSETNAS